MMAELMGKAAGYCKGRSGSMHIAAAECGILGANAIMAAGIPMALGAAYALAANRQRRVVVAFFGDGAVAEGAFHESMNMASLWKLPLVFVCEKNQYAEMTPIGVHLSNQQISGYANSYKIPGVTVDGNDVVAVQTAAIAACDRARTGMGPSLIECETYRIRGHFEGDKAPYRPEPELEQWRARDPIALLETRLRDSGLSESTLVQLKESVRNGIEEAVRFAEAAPPATTNSIREDIYGAGGAAIPCGTESRTTNTQ
jgi:pyruvate dehydrogenase E1 component alpha subunit